MTVVRFDLIHREASRDHDTLICRVELPEVPVVGELVNIDGDPYRVIARSWAFSSETEGLYAFLRMLKAGG